MPSPPGTISDDDDTVHEWPYFGKYTVEESEIPPKYREIVGHAVAANVKRPYCATFHREAAEMHGATDDELREAYSLASFTTRYSAMMHAQGHPLDEFEEKLERIAERQAEDGGGRLIDATGAALSGADRSCRTGRGETGG